ncbi:MAG: glycogen/starch/alpha-glucan phosphorylase [bacterium]
MTTPVAKKSSNTSTWQHQVTPAIIRASFEHHLRYTLARDIFTATDRDRHYALAMAVRDQVVERWLATQQTHHRKNVKRVYYLSLEFLIGRLLGSNVINLNIEDSCRKAMSEIGLNWNDLRDSEVDAGLGNGGLGRLAACFMDSLSTLKYPAVGYGLRYDYGIFNQKIINGYQVEEPDAWLKNGYPWEIPHPEFSFFVRFGGHVSPPSGDSGSKWRWDADQIVVGTPYDLPIVGYGGEAVNTLRLWSARAAEDFHLDDFNRGSYVEAVETKVLAENLTKVLYPNDNIFVGKELRLRQEYFFVSCSLQDIIRRFKVDNDDLKKLPDKVFMQMNDTHPSLAVPELMRLLMDDEGLGWDEAWAITSACVGYTNHTILPEALEKWPLDMLGNLLPRHLLIINEINARFLRTVSMKYPLDNDRLRRMSIIEEGPSRYIRMAHLAAVGSCSINGVSQLHTRLLQEQLLQDFAALWPAKFNNKTNGITPRRWLLKANPGLAELISDSIGTKWITDLEELHNLERFVKDAAFVEEFHLVKQRNKTSLAAFIQQEMNIIVSPLSLFDIQIKRLHEYKRQLLLVLYIIMIYNRIKDSPGSAIVPRTFIFGAKAAPGFFSAKLIIKLINQVADVVNADPQIADQLKVIFLSNYRVSLAERIIPAANLSEQISLAGTEASGTGNMKLQLNGALTIGTLDGANVEILEEVGQDNIFIFGMKTEEVLARRPSYNPRDFYESDPDLRRAIDMIARDYFSMVEPGIFLPLVRSLLDEGDRYMLLADFRSYVEAQEQVAATWVKSNEWDRKAILNVAHAGKFSADRTIREYARDIWNLPPCSIEGSSYGTDKKKRQH